MPNGVAEGGTYRREKGVRVKKKGRREEGKARKRRVQFMILNVSL